MKETYSKNEVIELLTIFKEAMFRVIDMDELKTSSHIAQLMIKGMIATAFEKLTK